MDNILNQLLTHTPQITTPQYLERFDSKLAHKAKRLVEIMERERIETNNEREKLQTLLSDISHQIKTPMTNIRLYNELLQERLETENLNLLNKSSDQITQLEWLLEQLIKTARLETGIISIQPQISNLKTSVIQAVESLFKEADHKNIQFHIEHLPDQSVYHDKKWSIEAIKNILDNGIKYSPVHSIITINLKKHEMYTELSITDQGLGVKPEDYNNIFKRFYRAEDVYDRPGIGLGLYISQYICNNQGGYITVKQNHRKEVGSTFSMFFRNVIKL